MQELPVAIPDVTTLIALTPEELGAKVLFLLRERSDRMFHPGNLKNELWNLLPHLPQYPPQYREQVEQALIEAFAWLTAQGLIVPAGGANGNNGWRVLSRRARAMETEREFTSFTVGRLLPKERLHPKIADSVWAAFMRGEFDGAAFHAMKGVEVAVRVAAGLGNDVIGTNLMRKAFAPQDGPLTDMTAEGGERQRPR